MIVEPAAPSAAPSRTPSCPVGQLGRVEASPDEDPSDEATADGAAEVDAGTATVVVETGAAGAPVATTEQRQGEPDRPE
ncbi:hypothetical protein GCM10023201_52880 [Actinomycetospora corticicola]